jgi:hypothetical protein
VRIWTSGELQHDVGEPFRFARKDVERELSNSVLSEDYGAGVIKWALIYILLPANDSFLPEIQRYKKRKREVEFRLKVDHQAFKESDAFTQRRLLAAAFLRSIDLSGELGIADFDAERFKLDVVQVLKTNDWL